MKKMRNLILIFVIVVGVILVTLGVLYKINTSPVSNSDEIKEITIEKGANIGKVLKDNNLIRSELFFKIYSKLFSVDGKLKAGKYELKESMSFNEIIDILKEGNNYNENEISLIFREGINMRKVASIIASGTNNKEEDVFSLLKDEEYLNSLINDYWFITNDIKNDKIYYSLEGYLYPDTYRFASRDVTVKEIFNKLIKKMDSVLTPLKEKIEKSKFNVHEILTLASMAEKEENKKEYRDEVVSVFVNRIEKKMSLGSDVTTRYALKIDDAKKVLKKSEYAYASPYNTRLTDGSMNGKLPVGPISTVSDSSILAAINYADTDYLYFIANINSNETFFFSKSSDFEKKKRELSSVNNGL